MLVFIIQLKRFDIQQSLMGFIIILHVFSFNLDKVIFVHNLLGLFWAL